MGLKKLGSKVVDYGKGAHRLGVKAAHHVSRLGKKYLPHAKMVVNMIGEMGKNHSAVGKAVGHAKTLIGHAETAEGYANTALAMNKKFGMPDYSKKPKVTMLKRRVVPTVKPGDHQQALALKRQDVRRPNEIRNSVKQQVSHALSRGRAMRGDPKINLG